MWYKQLQTEGTLTPVLLIHPETITENIAEMISSDRGYSENDIENIC